MKLLKIYLFLILIKIILLVSCKKDPVNYCKTGSINAPYSNKFGYDNIGIQKKITFKINGQPFSLNCPETDKNEYFFIYYLHLKQSNFEPIQNFILGFKIPNYPEPNLNSSFYISIFNIFSSGVYQLEHQFLPRNRENKSELQIYEGLGNKVSYYYVQRQSYGWLELSNFDTISQKISGRFELDLVNEKNYSDTIKVREGIFDGWFSMVR